jgi:hypothetical protein
LALAVAGVLAATASVPAVAQAHGPVAPVALDYLALVRQLPPGLDAKVVDGDQRMWLQVPAGETVVVLDYRGAPYLRFTRQGVAVNHNSPMYYLNQTPVALRPPPSLGPKTPPKWLPVTSAHAYGWHDGRLHALAAVALAPGASFVGTWRVPIVVDGRSTAISGGLWHRGPPSLVWFWPIAVLLLCLLAERRLRRPALDQWTARLLGVAALAAVAVAAVGYELHGRPVVSTFQLATLAAILAFVVWGLFRVIFQRAGFLTYLVIAIVALWHGLELFQTLDNGFVLIALPAFVARTASVVALGAGIGLLLMVFRLAELRHERSQEDERQPEELESEDWELA